MAITISSVKIVVSVPSEEPSATPLMSSSTGRATIAPKEILPTSGMTCAVGPASSARTLPVS